MLVLEDDMNEKLQIEDVVVFVVVAAVVVVVAAAAAVAVVVVGVVSLDVFVLIAILVQYRQREEGN